MNITSKGRYALRLMVDLAQQADGGYVSLKTCADRQEISLKYLEAIAGELKRAGLLESGRGKEGGYRLSRAPESYTAGEILRCMEESLAPVTCIRSGETGCERAAVCPTLPLWQELDALINRYLDGISLRDLVTGERWKTAAEKNKD